MMDVSVVLFISIYLFLYGGTFSNMPIHLNLIIITAFTTK